MFRVMRHGGRSTHAWRLLYEGDDEAKARKVFMDASWSMRQGGLRLYRVDGSDEVLLTSEWAPRLRTRW